MPATLHQPAATSQSLPWVEPLTLAGGLKHDTWALLYSSAQGGYSGRYSYLAWDVADRIEAEDFAAFEKALTQSGDSLSSAWFGYLGYGLKDCLERTAREEPGFITLPNLLMLRFHAICEFDHESRTLTFWSDNNTPLPIPATANHPVPNVRSLASPMPKAEYLNNVAHIVERIEAGDLYQANLTRKFQGEFEQAPDTLSLFSRLCEKSPAPYSACIKLGDTAIISSSPERFLSIDSTGKVSARPIKGTAARTEKPEEDVASLSASGKDRAENLMIVDLMRNDLSRACVPGSVTVEKLFEVTSHATIHHMSSTITGQKRPEASALDVVKACFPPGSMTGAPKIKAMDLCARLERFARGVYSGAIGRFGGDGSCDLSVVIRTLVVQKEKFEFQVGGGIVADSKPEKEHAEIMEKARGILAALGIGRDRLEAL